MSKYCSNCGKRIEQDSKFCSGCGKTLVKEEKEEKKADEKKKVDPYQHLRDYKYGME